MNFADLSAKIQDLFRPYHTMPCVNTLLALDWINAGLDPEKQILPVLQECIASKVRAGNPVPTTLKYYDTVIKGLNKKAEPNIINETELERDSRRAKNIRFKLRMLNGGIDTRIENELASLESKYGKGFGMQV